MFGEEIMKNINIPFSNIVSQRIYDVSEDIKVTVINKIK